MPKKDETPLELKEACVLAARDVIAEHGVENLSLREVARKLGVSHQAPYKHYPSRDHLLAEVMRRCFEGFARHLDAREHSDEPMEDMSALGQEYLRYALEKPLEYRLMFGTPWPENIEHPGLLRDARHAFDVLRKVLARMHGNVGAKRDLVDLDALFVWSCMHGLASISQSNVMEKLALRKNVLKNAVPHTMQLVGAALSAPR
jgi:AcrR family transcriptional regulator